MHKTLNTTFAKQKVGNEAVTLCYPTSPHTHTSQSDVCSILVSVWVYFVAAGWGCILVSNQADIKSHIINIHTFI